MPKSIHERVRAAQAAQAKARATEAHKAAEPARRSVAARMGAQTRKDNRLDAVIEGRVEPRTADEYRALDRAEFWGDES